MILEHPLRLGRGQNDRRHWRATRKAWDKEKAIVGWLMLQARRPPTPVTFTLTRVSPSAHGLDDDNLTGSLKATRDAIAAWIGIDDRHRELVRYEYRNARGPWGVRIEWTS